MATNYRTDGRRVTCTAPSGGTVSGRLYIVGIMFGIALTAAPAGATYALAIGGVWELPKATGALAQGVVVYWDAANSQVTATASGNTKIGVAETAAASGDSAVTVRLNSSF